MINLPEAITVMPESWHFYLMASIYILAGITHFAKSEWYTPVIPPYFKSKRFLVLFSGALEICLGILLLVPAWQPLALKGIILMLLSFLPVHIYMIRDKRFLKAFPEWLLWLRIPLQFGLVYWAYSYL